MLGLLFSLIISSSGFAEVGKIMKMDGAGDAVITRVNGPLTAVVNLGLEEGDEIETKNSVIVLHLYPSTQISLNENSRIQITQALIQESTVGVESTSVIKLLKGLIRLQISKEINQKINQEVTAGDVSFGVRGTEFEVDANDLDNVDLDVYEGEVTVSSPYVQTFVPEIVKANEGFRFQKKKRIFLRRKFQPNFKNHPGFMAKKKLFENWKKIKAERKSNRVKAVNNKLNNRERRKK